MDKEFFSTIINIKSSDDSNKKIVGYFEFAFVCSEINKIQTNFLHWSCDVISAAEQIMQKKKTGASYKENPFRQGSSNHPVYPICKTLQVAKNHLSHI